mmetsp:Transcript_21424/g.32672  ORF Transcript_21424/g.32672 Transcript_21424/m.32672 type:complete len:309 (+) Transcript_21424:121-1047(+)
MHCSGSIAPECPTSRRFHSWTISCACTQQNIQEQRVVEQKAGRGMRLQGLQASWRGSAFGEIHTKCTRREGFFRSVHCRGLRLSGRMRLWSKHRAGWKTDQWCEGCGGRREGTRHPFSNCGRGRKLVDLLFFLFFIILSSLDSAHGYAFMHGLLSPSASSFLCSRMRSYRTRPTTDLVMYSNMNINEGESIEDDDTPVILEDLDWRIAKLRLEEENLQRMLKSRPRKLPYEECRRWVQAWGGRWLTEDDWNDWIMMGEKRNAYIPARPDEYYTRTGDWVSWDHFLIEKSDDRDEKDDVESNNEDEKFL